MKDQEHYEVVKQYMGKFFEVIEEFNTEHGAGTIGDEDGNLDKSDIHISYSLIVDDLAMRLATGEISGQEFASEVLFFNEAKQVIIGKMIYEEMQNDDDN